MLEYGAGNTSLFRVVHTGQVVPVESSQRWYRYLAGIAPQNPDMMRKTAQKGHVSVILGQAHKFDDIGMHGEWRNACAAVCKSLLATGGIINNSGWHCRVCDALRDKVYSHVDFSGFGPVNWYASTTSPSPGCP